MSKLWLREDVRLDSCQLIDRHKGTTRELGINGRT